MKLAEFVQPGKKTIGGYRVGDNCPECMSGIAPFQSGVHDGRMGDDAAWCWCEQPWKSRDMLFPNFCDKPGCECRQ